MVAERDKESNLWGWLRDAMPRMDERKHVHRVEDSTKGGTPDVEGCVEGGQPFWMELKVAYEQARSIRVKTTDKQVYFALKRSQVGALAWYLIRVGKGPGREHFLIPGGLAEQLMHAVTIDWLRAHSACDPHASAPDILRTASRVHLRA